MRKPNDRLRSHKEGRGHSIYDLSEEWDCSPSTTSKILGGTRSPGRRLAVAIARYTADAPGGPVLPSDWPDTPTASVPVEKRRLPPARHAKRQRPATPRTRRAP